MDLEWRDRERPDDAPRVVVRLDDRLHRAADPDAVTAEHQRLMCPVLGEVGRLHLFGVVRAELEDVADLDATLDRHPSAALRTGIALAYVVHVNGLAFEVAPRQDIAHVRVLLVRAGDVRPRLDRRVDQ